MALDLFALFDQGFRCSENLVVHVLTGQSGVIDFREFIAAAMYLNESISNEQVHNPTLYRR